MAMNRNLLCPLKYLLVRFYHALPLFNVFLISIHQTQSGDHDQSTGSQFLILVDVLC